MTKIVFDCTQVSFFLHQFIDGEADEATCAVLSLPWVLIGACN